MSWADDAACSPANGAVDVEWWWPPTGVDADADLAEHICRTHCPVRAQCDQQARATPPRHPVVLGGRRYVSGSGGGPCLPTIRTPRSVSDCPYCLLEEVSGD